MTDAGTARGAALSDAAGLGDWLRDHVEGFREPVLRSSIRGRSVESDLFDRFGGRPLRASAQAAEASSCRPPTRSSASIGSSRRCATAAFRSPARARLCEDESVIGTAFYVMDYVEGRTFWDDALPDVPPGERRAIFGELSRVLAALHSVDFGAAGLADYGKPGQYVERQVARWTKQYRASQTEIIEAMERLIERLPRHIPPGEETCHRARRLSPRQRDLSSARAAHSGGDRLGTIDLGPPLGRSRVSLPCACACPRMDSAALGGLDLERLEIPSEAEFVADYCRPPRPRAGGAAGSGRTILRSTCFGWRRFCKACWRARCRAMPRAPTRSRRAGARAPWQSSAGTRAGTIFESVSRGETHGFFVQR